MWSFCRLALSVMLVGMGSRRAVALRLQTAMRLQMASSDGPVLNKYSRTITEPPSQGASQAMLYATGLTPSNIKLPQVRFVVDFNFHQTEFSS